MCIGQAMATAELRGIVSAVLQRFRLLPIEPRGPRLANCLTLAPADGVTRVELARSEATTP